MRSILDLRPARNGGHHDVQVPRTTSENGSCPTLYEVVETGDLVVQGDRLTNPEHLAQLRDVRASETFVVPRELLMALHWPAI